MYWERGGSGFGLCAVHCLNSLLQGPLVSEVQLAEIGHELDREEAQLLGLAPGEVDAGPSQNVDANGNFSSQVLLRALQLRFDLQAVDAMHEDVRDAVLERPQLECGYVCNSKRHWFALRSLSWNGRPQWFNLDSRSVEGPTFLDSKADLPALLKSVRAERGTIFVVRGDFPQTSGDTLAAGDGFLEGHQLLLDDAGLRSFRQEASQALDESVAHRLLDFAKVGQWTTVFAELRKVEQARENQTGPRYVDMLPFPRRFALIHYAAAQGREEAVKKLMVQFSARLDLKTSEGVTTEDLALQMNHRGVAELVASERQARERAGAEVSPKAVPRCTSRASNNSVQRSGGSNRSLNPDMGGSHPPSYADVAAIAAIDQAPPQPVPPLPPAPAPLQPLSSSVQPPSASLLRPLEDAVAHKLLDLAKYGKWDELFMELAAADRGSAAGSRCYVDYFPAPRRYNLVHFAANQGRAEVLRRLIEEFGARPDVKTSDGFGAADIVATPAHKEEVKAVLRAAARARK